MEFDETVESFSEEKQNVFCTKSDNDYEKFSKEVLSNFFVVSYNTVLTNLLIKSCEKTKNFLLKVRNWQNFFLKIRRFSWKWFSGPLECNFHNRFEIFASKNQKILAQRPKVIKIPIFQKGSISTQSVPMDKENPVLITLPKKFCQQAKNFVLKVRKRWKNAVPSKEHNFSSTCTCGHVESSFDKPVGKNREKAKVVCSSSEKDKKTFRKTLLLKMFLWTRIMLFR